MGDDLRLVGEIPSGSVIVAGSISATKIAVGSVSAGKLPRHLGSILPPLFSEPEPSAAPVSEPIQRPRRRTRAEVWI